MEKEYYDQLVKHAERGDYNAKVILDRIKKGLPMQGGKPTKIEVK